MGNQKNQKGFFVAKFSLAPFATVSGVDFATKDLRSSTRKNPEHNAQEPTVAHINTQKYPKSAPQDTREPEKNTRKNPKKRPGEHRRAKLGFVFRFLLIEHLPK